MNPGHPYNRVPPVAWWQLWPGVSGGNGKSPATGYPTAKRQFLAVPVATLVTLAPGQRAEYRCTLVEMGWTFRSQALAMTANKDIFVTVSDIASGRVLAKEVPTNGFVGGEGGKQWAQFTYILGERQTLLFEFRSAAVAPIANFNCAVLGTYERGVV